MAGAKVRRALRAVVCLVLRILFAVPTEAMAASAETITTAAPTTAALGGYELPAMLLATVHTSEATGRLAAPMPSLDRTGSRLVSSSVVAAKSAALTEREIGTTVDDVLQDASFYKQSQATHYLKSGGFGQANADFDALAQGVNVIERGGGLRTATLSNGTKINVRPFSSGKYPTLEIDTPGNPVLKIRY